MIGTQEFEEDAVDVLGFKRSQYFLNKIEYSSYCWHWTAAKNSKGYGKFILKGKSQFAHRVSWLVANGCWPNDKALHTCNNPGCVNPNHLYDGSNKDNMNDRTRAGHSVKKLSDFDVALIKALLDQGFNQYVIAEMFNVGQAAISYINRGKHS